MTGRLSGVATKMAEAAADGVVRVWCALHQLDLVVQAEYLKLYDDQFVNILTGLVSYLRRQFNLIGSMGCTCPKYMDMRWSSMKKLSTFLRRVRCHLRVPRPEAASLYPTGCLVGRTACARRCGGRGYCCCDTLARTQHSAKSAENAT
jgi:hypothetical protein